MTIGQKIQARRLELSLDRSKICRKIGINCHTLERVERDLQFSVPVITKLCAVLDLSMDFLFKDTIDQYKNKFGVYATPDKYRYGVFYHNVQEECRKQNISFKGLLRSCKLSENTGYAWKNGSKPRFSTAEKIAKSLGVSPDYLLKKH